MATLLIILLISNPPCLRLHLVDRARWTVYFLRTDILFYTGFTKVKMWYNLFTNIPRSSWKLVWAFWKRLFWKKYLILKPNHSIVISIRVFNSPIFKHSNRTYLNNFNPKTESADNLNKSNMNVQAINEYEINWCIAIIFW